MPILLYSRFFRTIILHVPQLVAVVALYVWARRPEMTLFATIFASLFLGAFFRIMTGFSAIVAYNRISYHSGMGS